MNRSAHRNTKKGFTLIELLVVMTIIAILAVAIFVMINPLELDRRARDATRLSDMANLQQAINVAIQESSGDPNNPALCVGTVPSGGNYTCAGSSTDSGARAIDGTGWVKVNLGSVKSVTIPVLPVDPTNSSGSSGYHYSYCAHNDQYEIDTVLESDQQKSKMSQDGGDDDNKYEVGSNLDLIDVVSGCSY